MPVVEENGRDMRQLSELSGDDYKIEALRRAADERADIVNKYAMGVDSEGEEDHWEDAAFKVYKITDRYGFLHEHELSELPSQEEERRKIIEVKRSFKWAKMLDKWKLKWKSFEGSEKLRSRVFKGIPLSLRGDAWRLMLNVAELMEKEPNVYDKMKERSEENSPDIKQIDMDVNRTYRNHIMFRKRYSIKQQQLFHVLAAYSMYNTEVGYCQGMSQIAALLLMFMSEEEAFWALHSLLYGKKHRMHGFFIPGFPKLLRFQDHHDKILKKFMPRLKKHLDKNEVFASLYSLKWFFQCFLDRTPFPLTLRLWDAYVLEGERVLVAMSYTTLKMHKTILKKMEMDEIVSFLQEQLVENFGADEDTVIENLKNNMAELRRAKMDYPPPPGENETPKLPFGIPVKASFEQETGIRNPAKLLDENSPSKRTKQNNQGNKQSTQSNRVDDNKANGSALVVSGGTQSSAYSSKAFLSNEAGTNSSIPEKSHKKSSKKSKEKSGGKGSQKESRSSSKKDKSKKENQTSTKDKKRSKLKSEAEEDERVPENTGKDEAFLSSGDNRRPPNNLAKRSLEQQPQEQRQNGNDRPNVTAEPVNQADEHAQFQLPSSTQHVSQSESFPSEKRSNRNPSESGKVKLVWKTPSPSKVHPSSSPLSPPNSSVAPQERVFKNKVSHKLPTTNRVTRSVDFRSENGNVTFYEKSQSEDGALHKKRIKSNKIEESGREIKADITETNTVIPGQLSKKSPPKKSITFTFDPARPYSVYDNVKDSTLTESEDDLVTDSNLPVFIPSPTVDVELEGAFENIMEESLENLRELAEGLNRTPSPFVSSARRYSSRKELSPLATSKSFDPVADSSSKSEWKSSRPKSLGLEDEELLSPLDHLVHSLSRSADVLEEDQKKKSSTSNHKDLNAHRDFNLHKSTSVQNQPNFEKMEGARAWKSSEHQHNYVVGTSADSNSSPIVANLSSLQQSKRNNAGKHKKAGGWQESDLDAPLPYGCPSHSSIESQPIPVSFSRNQNTANNNNRSTGRTSPPLTVSFIPGRDFPTSYSAQQKAERKKYSSQAVADNGNVTVESDAHSVSHHSSAESSPLNTGHLPKLYSSSRDQNTDDLRYLPQSSNAQSKPDLRDYSSKHFHSSHPHDQRFAIRHRQPSTAPPAYTASSSRQFHFSTPENVIKAKSGS